MFQKSEYPLKSFPVDMQHRNGDRHYTLTLDYSLLNDLLTTDSGSGLISQYAKDGVSFRLFHRSGMDMDTAFRPMPEGVEYFAYIGDMSLRTVADLVKLLKRNSPMPIELESVIRGDRKPINLGYVHFKTVFGEPKSIDETLK